MSERSQRIRDDLEALAGLQEASTIFTYQAHGDPPERFTLRYHGSGLGRESSPAAKAEILREHELEMRLPYGYPTTAPDVRWVTPLFHPNVSFSGFVNLADIGIDWNPELGLDVVCERLWDAIRLDHANPERAVNYAAKKWLAEQTTIALPVDARPLRDKAALSNRNIVRYRRRGQPEPTGPGAADVLFIDDDDTSPLPPAGKAGIRGKSDDGILFIE